MKIKLFNVVFTLILIVGMILFNTYNIILSNNGKSELVQVNINQLTDITVSARFQQAQQQLSSDLTHSVAVSKKYSEFRTNSPYPNLNDKRISERNSDQHYLYLSDENRYASGRGGGRSGGGGASGRW